MFLEPTGYSGLGRGRVGKTSSLESAGLGVIRRGRRRRNRPGTVCVCEKARVAVVDGW